MKNLPFIREELTEARMFTAPKDIRGMPMKDIAELIWLMFMLLEVIRWFKPSYAQSYASKTMETSPYDKMFYSATDLSNLLSVLLNQDTFAGQIKTDFSISLPLFQMNRYLGDIRSGSKAGGSTDQTFFWRLEDYLKVYSNSVFRQMRRQIGNWTDLSYADKTRITQQLRRELDNRGSRLDLYYWFRQNFKVTESIGYSLTSTVDEATYHVEADTLTSDEVLEKYPMLEADMNEMPVWLSIPLQQVGFIVDIEPMEHYAKQAQEMLSTFDEFPEDAERTYEIERKIKRGEPAWPVFVDPESDDFVMEGRHRLASQFLMKRPFITVVRAFKMTDNTATAITESSVVNDTSSVIYVD